MVKSFIQKTTKEEFEKLQPRCNCLCNELIIWSNRYVYVGIPLYKKGHCRRKKEILTEDIYNLTGPHYCNCKNHEIIEWKDIFRYTGIPKYLSGHCGRKLSKQEKEELIFCESGCGQLIRKYDNRGRRMHYCKGHSSSRKNPIKITKEEFEATGLHYCSCPDKEIIEWQDYFSYFGIPKYKKGHINKGKTWVMSEETKDKLSKIQKENPSRGHLGKKHTSETKYKMSTTRKGRYNQDKCYWFGKKRSDEDKEKMSEGQKGRISWNKGKTTIEQQIKYFFRRKVIPFRRLQYIVSEEKKEILRQYTGEKASNWKGGISFEPYCYKFNEPKKEEVRNEYCRLCLNCGKDETANGRRQTVHHIDYDKEQGCKGKEFNLIPLCISCNSKANFNRVHWEEHYKFVVRLWKIKMVWTWWDINI